MQKTFFLYIVAYTYFFLYLCEATMKAHWTDFVPERNAHDQIQDVQGNPPNDSHRALNRQSKHSTHHQAYSNSEIHVGHTQRRRFIPLMRQRNQHEERVNGALVAGIVLRKGYPRASHSLFHYAHEQRSTSQEIQRRMDHIKSEGYIDPSVMQRISQRRKMYLAEKKKKIENDSSFWDRLREKKKMSRYSSQEGKRKERNGSDADHAPPNKKQKE